MSLPPLPEFELPCCCYAPVALVYAANSDDMSTLPCRPRYRCLDVRVLHEGRPVRRTNRSGKALPATMLTVSAGSCRVACVSATSGPDQTSLPVPAVRGRLHLQSADSGCLSSWRRAVRANLTSPPNAASLRLPRGQNALPEWSSLPVPQFRHQHQVRRLLVWLSASAILIQVALAACGFLPSMVQVSTVPDPSPTVALWQAGDLTS